MPAGNLDIVGPFLSKTISTANLPLSGSPWVSELEESVIDTGFAKWRVGLGYPPEGSPTVTRDKTTGSLQRLSILCGQTRNAA
jgi:hypothetical protein